MTKFNHPYHLVTLSPWPLMGSFSLLILMVGSVLNLYELNKITMFLGLYMLLTISFQWWRDVIRESSFQGFHTFEVIMGLKLGMFLFILSELMFFLSFFWTYFHLTLSPSVEVGSLWPPLQMEVFNPYNIPLLNTIILLFSGMTLTYAHHSILNEEMFKAKFAVLFTVFLGLLFSIFQYLEYSESYFSINDSVYGSIFFMATGFHGIHVIIGTLCILVSFMRLKNYQFSINHHIGFEFASWYWHFVDLVWLFLYLFMYWLSY